ncbi:hypothetical protein BDZ45DRAFT_510100 [Acephala macrosclerotiorum]|nr:hypothetical protein BDZ45DRAFT_510100 [Acephala macrosclerotiorum]
MKLRNRAIGVGGTFYPFKRLPIELRHMIWRFSLEPRVVEARWKSTKTANDSILDQNDMRVRFEETNDDPADASLGPADEVRYYSPAALPTAFRVCRDSRNAVDSLYPLCFSSKTHGPGIKFNLSLDILYLDGCFDQRVYRTNHQQLFMPSDLRIYGFLESLSPVEVTNLQNIAVSDAAGFSMLRNDTKTYKYWNQLEVLLQRLTGPRNILTVHEIAETLDLLAMTAELNDMSNRAAILDKAYDRYSCNAKDRCLELFDDFPADLVKEIGLLDHEVPIAGYDSRHRGRGN